MKVMIAEANIQEMMAEKREQPTGPPEIELEDFAPPEEEEDDIHSEDTIYFDQGLLGENDDSVDTRVKQKIKESNEWYIH